MAVRTGMRAGRLFPLILATALAASAGMAGDIPEPLRRCAALEDDAHRLACYDRYVARGGAESGAADSAPPAERSGPGAEAADPAATAESRFGLPADIDEDELDEISATITDIVVRANQERIFTLDNGQVWVEDSPKRSLRLEVGDEVTISSGLFGSYRLRGSSRRSTAVDRVR